MHEAFIACSVTSSEEAPPSDPPHRSRSSSLNLSNAPAPSTSLWAPSEQLRTRAQRHQQAVHAATKEAMVAEEDDQNMVLTVDVPGICGWEFGRGCCLCTGLGSLKPVDLVQKPISDSQPHHMVNVAELP